MGQEWGGEWMGWGCIRPEQQRWKALCLQKSVKKKKKTVHDYSAGLLISMSFGEAQPHHSLSVCTSTSQPQTVKHTQPKFINTHFCSLFISLSFPPFSHSFSTFWHRGAEWQMTNFCSAVSERETRLLRSRDTFDTQPLQISHEAASVEWIGIPIICVIEVHAEQQQSHLCRLDW